MVSISPYYLDRSPTSISPSTPHFSQASDVLYNPNETFGEKSAGDSFTLLASHDERLPTDRPPCEYFLVDTDCLEQLLQICPKCKGDIQKINWDPFRGASITAKTVCENNCENVEWSSSKKIRSAAKINFDIATAALVTGTGTTDITRFMAELGVHLQSRKHIIDLQEAYGFPAVKQIYKKHRSVLVEELKCRDEGCNFSGDARFDSPGFSAKFGTYSLMEEESHKVVQFHMAHCRTSPSSVAKEKDGFEACVQALQDEEVRIEGIATDRHPTISQIADLAL